jgi:thiol-disulfide isomerase/thioredoxin
MRHTNQFKACVLFALVIALSSCGTEQQPDKQTETLQMQLGGAAPAWAGSDLVSGNMLSFPSLLDDKPAVLIFWATWCPYCKAFMPYAGRIQSDYAEHGVQIVTFNAKERGEGDPKAYVNSLNFPMIAIADADNIAASYGVNFIPGLMVVDGAGDFRYLRGWTDLPAGKTVAKQWDGEVRDALNNILGL